MRAEKTCVLLTASLVALALAVGGCGNSPSDGGGSTSNSSNEAPSSDSSYGY